jgi:hypothetical protein
MYRLQDVTKDELLAKFQQCHDALREGGKRNPAEALDEMSKCCYLYRCGDSARYLPYENRRITSALQGITSDLKGISSL